MKGQGPAGGDLYLRIFKKCPDAISITRLRDGRFLTINDGFTALTGYRAEDVEGKTTLDVDIWVNPEDRVLFLERLQSKGEVRDFLAHFRVRDGSTRKGSVSARLITLGTDECALSFTRDVSERKEAEDVLRRYHEAASIVETASLGIYIVQNGSIIYGNQWLREFSGIGMADLPMDALGVIAPEDRAFVAEQMMKRIQGKESLSQYSVRFLKKDGSKVHVELIAKIVSYEGQPAILGSIVDVSAKVAAEMKLREYAAMLEESNRLKQLYNEVLSHDLLDPLWAVNGYTDFLLEGELAEKERKYALAMKDSLKDARDILYDALAYLELGEGSTVTFSTMDIAVMLKETLSSFKADLERKEMVCDFKVSGELPAEANVILKQAFSNLLANGIKYSPEGTLLAVEAQAGPPLRIAFRSGGDRIPEGDRERIFERFEREGKKGIKGVGLGLAIVRKIVALHGGRVWVEDNPEGGNVFVVELPRHRG